MKFIHLVLYSKNNIYDKMKIVSEEYYNKFNNVITFYYCFNNDITTNYKIDGNFLYFKGNETYIPGIITKTIKALEFIYKNKYYFDYIIRSNISTIIDFKLLEEELTKNPIEYYGGGIIFSAWDIEHKINNIHKKTYYNNNFISGTSIILSKKGLSFIIKNKNNIVYDTIDDIAIGVLFNNYCNYIIKNGLKCIGRWTETKDKINFKHNNIFYRCKYTEDTNNMNRNIDLIKMKKIIKYLINSLHK